MLLNAEVLSLFTWVELGFCLLRWRRQWALQRMRRRQMLWCLMSVMKEALWTMRAAEDSAVGAEGQPWVSHP